jgi:hypothetical protein
MPQYQLPRPMPPIGGATTQQTYVFPQNQPDQLRYAAKRGLTAQVTPPLRSEGATSQQTYVFPPNQPEVSRYSAQRGLRTQVAPPPRVEGATVQAWFIYPPNQPELSRFSARQALRYVVPAPPRVHESVASQAQTYVFPVSQPERKYYVRTTFADTELPFDGPSAVVAQTYVFPLSQPDQARAASLQANRFIVAAAKQLDGAVVHESYLFTVGQPQGRRQIQMARPKAPIDVTTVAVTQTDVFTSGQTDLARWAERHRHRYQVPAPARVHEGAPPQTYVFPLTQHYDARYYLRRPIVDAPEQVHDGAAAAVPQTYVFPIAQPELRAWLKFDANRVPAGPTPQTAGATNHGSFVFPLGQPEPRYYVRNTAAETKTPILGASVVVAQSYEFALNQPDPGYFVRRNTLAETKTPILGATVLVAQTYEFAVSQPEARRYNLPDANRHGRTGPVPQVTGASSQATDVFVPNQPEMQAYARLQRARGLGGSVAWPLDTFAPLVPVPKVIQVLMEAVTTATMTGEAFCSPDVTNEQVID